jgi:hypothetical protein
MLDLEASSASKGLSPAHIWAWTQEFIGAILKLTGK